MYLSGINTQDSSAESTAEETHLSDCTGIRPKFRFPPPPRLSRSISKSYACSQSDSSSSGFNFIKPRKRNKMGFVNRLPPLGIFWDIENCQVPKYKSASAVVQRIREKFLENYRESEFIVVCDVKKENSHIVQELHDSQVNLIHVSSTSKNAADEKLRQSLRRYAELHPAPSGAVLISGDVNFAADLADLRYRKKIRVILVHNANVADALILCANEHYTFSMITEDLPVQRSKVTSTSEPVYLTISNLPIFFEKRRLRNRLNLLTDNCGGRVVAIVPEEGLAYVKFGNVDFARRAQRRIQGEDVFGNKIKVVTSTGNYTGNKLKNSDSPLRSSTGLRIPPSPGFSHLLYNTNSTESILELEKQDQRTQEGSYKSCSKALYMENIKDQSIQEGRQGCSKGIYMEKVKNEEWPEQFLLQIDDLDSLYFKEYGNPSKAQIYEMATEIDFLSQCMKTLPLSKEATSFESSHSLLNRSTSSTTFPEILAPDPSELPMPDKLMSKCM